MTMLSSRARALSSAVAALARAPGLTALALALASSALALPLLAAALAWPLHGAWTRLEPPHAVVFAATAAAVSDIAALRLRIAGQPGVAGATHVPRDAALAELVRRAPGGALPDLKANPLPDAIVVRFVRTTPANEVDATVAALRKLPRVDSVHFDSTGYRRWIAAVGAAGLGGGALAALLGVLGLAGVLGAAQLTPVTGRAELRVLALAGATLATRRRPFTYAGGLIGLTGGLVAGGAVLALSMALVGRLADLPIAGALVLDGSQPLYLLSLGWVGSAGLIGLLVGLIGGRWAGGRAVRRAMP